MTIEEKLQEIDTIKGQFRDIMKLSPSVPFSDYPGITSDILQAAGGLDIYSEEERVVGIWFDGRPVYRRDYYVKNVSIVSGIGHIANISEWGFDIDIVPALTGSIGGYAFPMVRNGAILIPRIANSSITIRATQIDGTVNESYNDSLSSVSISFIYGKKTDRPSES